MRRIAYDCGEGVQAIFIPVCEKCGRFIKADKTIKVNESSGLKDEPNATCKKCGRIKMLFEGFF